MRVIKFRITYQHAETGRITERYIELGETLPSLGDGWAVIGKDQFTGLPDKNGKEMYGGDIVRTESAGDGRVLMDENGFWGIELFNIQGKPVHHLVYHARSGVVIGDIYKTPELLPSEK